MRFLLLFIPLFLSACSTQELKTYIPKKKNTIMTVVQPTNAAKYLSIAEADYDDQREKNYRKLRGRNNEGQYVNLDKVLSSFLMDMFASVPKGVFGSKLILADMDITHIEATEAAMGKQVTEELMVKKLQQFGFKVFEGRRPKGRLEGTELLLNLKIMVIGGEYELYGNLKQLDSNVLLASGHKSLPKYFFQSRKDGLIVKSQDLKKDQQQDQSQ